MDDLAPTRDARPCHRADKSLVHRGEETERDGCEDDGGLDELRRRRHRAVDVDELERDAP